MRCNPWAVSVTNKVDDKVDEDPGGVNIPAIAVFPHLKGEKAERFISFRILPLRTSSSLIKQASMMRILSP